MIGMGRARFHSGIMSKGMARFRTKISGMIGKGMARGRTNICSGEVFIRERHFGTHGRKHTEIGYFCTVRERTTHKRLQQQRQR